MLTTKNYTKDYFMDSKKRTLVLVIPGGGYERTSAREAVPVAAFFNDLNYHSAVYYYRETLLKYPDIFKEAYDVVSYYKKDERVKDILIVGFSAGGHLASYLLTQYPDSFKGGVLCYPVISSNPLVRHESSFKFLLDDIKNKAALESVSTELLVTDKMPPIFIWHTADDASVPVANSILFTQALLKHKHKVELHLFESGKHGLSLINEETTFVGVDSKVYVEENKDVAVWRELLKKWLKRLSV